MVLLAVLRLLLAGTAPNCSGEHIGGGLCSLLGTATNGTAAMMEGEIPAEEPSQQDGLMDNANERAAEEETSTARDTTVVIIDVIVIFLAGVAIVLAFVAITYLISKLTDLCDRRNGLYDEDDEIDRGSLTRKANLWGLRRSERQQILQHIFQSTTHLYSTKNDGDENNQKSTRGGDIEMGAVSTSTPITESEAPIVEAIVSENEEKGEAALLPSKTRTIRHLLPQTTTKMSRTTSRSKTWTTVECAASASRNTRTVNPS